MSAPNGLIVRADQLNGTLFPDRPADWLRGPDLNKRAAGSTHAHDPHAAWRNHMDPNPPEESQRFPRGGLSMGLRDATGRGAPGTTKQSKRI